MTARAYSERRKADREAMAAQMIVLATSHGCTVERTDSPPCIMLRIEAPGGLCVSIDVDGKSCQPDVHVIPWHMHYESDAKLARSFGDVNPHHQRKATHVRLGFDALHAELERGFKAAADGTAYEKG